MFINQRTDSEKNAVNKILNGNKFVCKNQSLSSLFE